MKKICFVLMALGFSLGSYAQKILLGDTNNDGRLTIEDVTHSVAVMLGNEEPQYVDAVGEFLTTNHVTGSFLMKEGMLDVQKHFMQGYEYVDLELSDGTLWATCNFRAQGPSLAGTEIVWNEVMLDKTVNRVYGNKWHVPTKAQVQVLLRETDASAEKMNGVDGVRFTSRRNGEKSIFIPLGSYWTNTPHETDSGCAYMLEVTTPSEVNTGLRSNSLLIRPVVPGSSSEGGFEGEGDGSEAA